MLSIVIGAISLAIWAYLLVARGGFWRCRPRDTEEAASPAVWPSVVAVVPARDESPHIGERIGALLRPDYPGPPTLLLVDSRSAGGTQDAAGRVAGAVP